MMNHRLLGIQASCNMPSCSTVLTRELALGRLIMIITTVVGLEIPQRIMEYSYGSRSESERPSNFAEEVQVEFEASSTLSMRAIPTG
jgi:hypothetical protein